MALIFQQATHEDGSRPFPVEADDDGYVVPALVGETAATVLIGFVDPDREHDVVMRADVEADPSRAVGRVPLYSTDGHWFTMHPAVEAATHPMEV